MNEREQKPFHKESYPSETCRLPGTCRIEAFQMGIHRKRAAAADDDDDRVAGKDNGLKSFGWAMVKLGFRAWPEPVMGPWA